jgi:dihydropyrimidinase
MYDLIVSGGRVVREDGVFPCDVAVREERIAEVAPRIAGPMRRRIDAAGLLVLPGLIDPHVHLGLQAKGTVSSDDVGSGTLAALHGGVTTIIDFTVQRPGQKPVESLRDRLAEFAGRAACDYALHVNLTRFPEGFEDSAEADLREVADRGATSVKVFTAYAKEEMRIDPDRLRTVLRAARRIGLQVLVHAEDDGIVSLAQRRLLERGETGVERFADSRPAEAEARAIAETIGTAGKADAAVYFVHVSTAAGWKAIREGRRTLSSPIYLETCPQYLVLDRSVYGRPDGAQFLVAPPLRETEDREALLDALSTGGVDVVATDHCPYRREQKERPDFPFTELPNGLPGVETRLPLLYTIGDSRNRLTVQELVRVTSANPARIFGLHPRKGAIEPGADADLVLFDPEARWVCDPSVLHMRTDFSPYAGLEMHGKVRTVLLRGRVVVDRGKTLIHDAGRWLPRTPRGAD